MTSLSAESLIFKLSLWDEFDIPAFANAAKSKRLKSEMRSFDSRNLIATRRRLALVLGFVCHGIAAAQSLPAGCGSLQRSHGPFDYRPERYVAETTYGSHKRMLADVETIHFTPEVEALIRGTTAGALPGGDLSYTLGVFPNHHRALIALSKLAIREKSPQPRQTTFTVDCYFQRAIVFRPDDGMVRMIYANYLTQTGRVPDAIAQLDVVASVNPESAFTQRNLSLQYFEAKEYEKSLVHAHRASELGLDIAAVKAQLQKVGKWRDAPPLSPAAVSDAASSPATQPPGKE